MWEGHLCPCDGEALLCCLSVLSPAHKGRAFGKRGLCVCGHLCGTHMWYTCEACVTCVRVHVNR